MANRAVVRMTVAGVSLGVVIGGCGLFAGPTASPGSQTQGRVVDRRDVGDRTLSQVANKTRKKKVRNHNARPPYTVTADINAGAQVFRRMCVTCHGSQGVGTTFAPRLAGPSGVVSEFGSYDALKTYIAHNMPADRPGSLSPVAQQDVAAYVWHIAGGK